MISYLDRMPCELPWAARSAVFGLRLWVDALKQGRHPPDVLAQLFRRFGTAGAAWPAHNFFYWVSAHVTRAIQLGCPCCGRVSDDEALLLAAIFAPNPETARAALSGFASPQTLEGAVRLALVLGAELNAHQLDAPRAG